MKTPEQKEQTKAKRALKRNFFMEALRRELRQRASCSVSQANNQK